MKITREQKDRKNIAQKEWRKNNPDKVKLHNERDRKYYYKNKQRILKKIKEWRKNNKSKCDGYIKKYRKNNKIKLNARARANRNIKKSDFKKCHFCNSKKKLERHHYNYNEHLGVIIVCRECHNKLHRGDSN